MGVIIVGQQHFTIPPEHQLVVSLSHLLALQIVNPVIHKSSPVIASLLTH